MVRKRFDVAPKINVKDEGMLIQQATGSTANLFEIKDAAGNTLISFSSSGIMSTSVTPSFNGGISTTDINVSGNVSITGGTTLSSNTSIGNVSSTEIGYLDGVTSNIQSQLDNKVSVANNAISQNQLSTSIPLSGIRNVLINGGMDIWQRGTAVKFNSGQGAYGPDRWCGAHQFQNSRTQQVSVASPASGMFCPYACRVSNPSTAEDGGGGSRMRLVQKVESVNSLFLRNKTVTLSFWIRFSSSNFTATSGGYGDFGYGIYAYTSTTDSATNTTAGDVASTASITAGSFPTSWTKYTLTYLVPSNTNNIEAQFGMSNLGLNTTGSVNWYEITQVQLEVGSQPTLFEQRPYNLELSLCQRYYCTIPDDYTIATIYNGAANYLLHGVQLPQTMRAAPSVGNAATTTIRYLINTGGNVDTSSVVVASGLSARSIYFVVTIAGYSTNGYAVGMRTTNITANAEL